MGRATQLKSGGGEGEWEAEAESSQPERLHSRLLGGRGARRGAPGKEDRTVPT